MNPTEERIEYLRALVDNIKCLDGEWEIKESLIRFYVQSLELQREELLKEKEEAYKQGYAKGQMDAFTN